MIAMWSSSLSTICLATPMARNINTRAFMKNDSTSKWIKFLHFISMLFRLVVMLILVNRWQPLIGLRATEKDASIFDRNSPIGYV